MRKTLMLLTSFMLGSAAAEASMCTKNCMAAHDSKVLSCKTIHAGDESCVAKSELERKECEANCAVKEGKKKAEKEKKKATKEREKAAKEEKKDAERAAKEQKEADEAAEKAEKEAEEAEDAKKY